MCIIAYFPPGVQPVREHLVEGVAANPHGFGWAIVTYNPDEPIIIGHTMDGDEAIETFMKLREQYPSDTAVFHARITTHGTTSLDNCHPFKVGGRSDMVLVHNGILPCTPKFGDKRSDTRVLADDILLRQFRHLDSVKTRRRFESWMGTGSKVVVLTTDRFYTFQSYIFNEDMGEWSEEGIWYSNDSYKPYLSSFKRRSTGYLYDSDDWYASNGYDWKWPTTVGASKVSPVDTVASGTVLLHLDSGEGKGMGCGQQLKRCSCSGSVWFSPVNLDKRGDEPSFWQCAKCLFFGTIDQESLVCDMCQSCFACDRLPDECGCVTVPTGVGAGKPGTDIVPVDRVL